MMMWCVRVLHYGDACGVVWCMYVVLECCRVRLEGGLYLFSAPFPVSPTRDVATAN